MTKGQLMEEGVDLERGTENVQRILGTAEQRFDEREAQAHLINDKPQRKTRSDAGKPKPKKEDHGSASHEEIMAGMAVATECALKIKSVPNRAVRHMIREMISIADKWDTQ